MPDTVILLLMPSLCMGAFSCLIIDEISPCIAFLLSFHQPTWNITEEKH